MPQNRKEYYQSLQDAIDFAIRDDRRFHTEQKATQDVPVHQPEPNLSGVVALDRLFPQLLEREMQKAEQRTLDLSLRYTSLGMLDLWNTYKEDSQMRSIIEKQKSRLRYRNLQHDHFIGDVKSSIFNQIAYDLLVTRDLKDDQQLLSKEATTKIFDIIYAQKKAEKKETTVYLDPNTYPDNLLITGDQIDTIIEVSTVLDYRYTKRKKERFEESKGELERDYRTTSPSLLFVVPGDVSMDNKTTFPKRIPYSILNLPTTRQDLTAFIQMSL